MRTGTKMPGPYTYSVDWIQYLGRHAIQCGGDLETKHFCLLVGCIQEFTRVNGINDFPGVRELDALADTISKQERKIINMKSSKLLEHVVDHCSSGKSKTISQIHPKNR
jgi:hypothetical protein